MIIFDPKIIWYFWVFFGSLERNCKVEAGARVRGNPRVTARDQCEVIMMIGLPGCGKSTWVAKHVADNPEKQYNVVSTGTMISKMTVSANIMRVKSCWIIIAPLISR